MHQLRRYVARLQSTSRYFLGNPKGVYCKTMKHPEMDGLAQVKSNIIMDYGDYLRAGIISNHNHKYGLDEQECFIKIEGTKGCIKITTGVYLDYPKGKPDVFKYNLLDDGKYTFIVSPDANKTEIKIAIEAIFDVKVTSVNTLNRAGKKRRTRNGLGKRPDTKRAIVTVAEGQRIDIFGQAV